MSETRPLVITKTYKIPQPDANGVCDCGCPLHDAVGDCEYGTGTWIDELRSDGWHRWLSLAPGPGCPWYEEENDNED